MNASIVRSCQASVWPRSWKPRWPPLRATKIVTFRKLRSCNAKWGAAGIQGSLRARSMRVGTAMVPTTQAVAATVRHEKFLGPGPAREFRVSCEAEIAQRLKIAAPPGRAIPERGHVFGACARPSSHAGHYGFTGCLRCRGRTRFRKASTSASDRRRVSRRKALPL